MMKPIQDIYCAKQSAQCLEASTVVSKSYPRIILV